MADANLARLEALLHSPLVIAHLIAPSRDLTAPELRHDAAQLRAVLREHHPHDPHYTLILDLLLDPESTLHELEREYLSDLLLCFLEPMARLLKTMRQQEDSPIHE